MIRMRKLALRVMREVDEVVKVEYDFFRSRAIVIELGKL